MTKRPRHILAAFAGIVFWGILCLGPKPSFADEPVFPKFMTFKVNQGGAISFAFQLYFEAPKETPDIYRIRMTGFSSLGFKTDEEFWSNINKANLSLERHAVKRDGKTQNEVYLDPNCESAFGGKTPCFRYVEQVGSEEIQTEIFTKHPAVDFISSLVVAADRAKKGGHVDLNFVINKSTKQISLDVVGQEKIDDKNTTVVVMKPKDVDVELYRFYIAKDSKGYYPYKMVYSDEYEKVEFVSQNVVW